MSKPTPSMLDVLLSGFDTAAQASRGAVKNVLGAPGDIYNSAVTLADLLAQRQPQMGANPVVNALRSAGPTKYGSDYFGRVLPKADPVSTYEPTIPRDENRAVVEDLLGPMMLGPMAAAQGVAGRAITKAGQPYVNSLRKLDEAMMQSSAFPGAPMIPVVFKKGGNWSKIDVRDDGLVAVTRPGYGFEDLSDLRQKIFQAARDKFGNKYDHFFRFTNNSKEIELAKAGLLRPSYNHADGFFEKGLSVSDGPHYGLSGYKYGYPIKGRALDDLGSDGETLLDVSTLQPLKSRVSTALDLMVQDRRLLEQNLKKRGLPQDYFIGEQQWLNNANTFEPFKGLEEKYQQALTALEKNGLPLSQSGRIDGRLLAALGIGGAGVVAGNSLLSGGKKRVEDAKSARKKAIDDAEK